MGSNRENSSIAIAILEELPFLKGNKNYFAFWWFQLTFPTLLGLLSFISKWLYTVEENIIGAPKMRNNIWSLSILQYSYFHLCSQFSYCSSNFAIAKLLFFISLLHFFCIAPLSLYIYIYRSLSLFKAKAKGNEKLAF